MFWNAKNGHIDLDDSDMDYISFGKGRDVLVMIPGLGDLSLIHISEPTRR